jgi:predicted nucleic acid-binding protein
MDLIYLDHNCYQRGFDDLSQVRILLEAIACQAIFSKAENNEVKLVWSFMNEDETMQCPFPERNYEIVKLAKLCKVRIGPEKKITDKAKEYQGKGRFSSKDALHLACAWYSSAEYFLTCDDDLLNVAGKMKLEFEVLNPVDYIREVGV